MKEEKRQKLKEVLVTTGEVLQEVSDSYHGRGYRWIEDMMINHNQVLLAILEEMKIKKAEEK
jgi:hypothetical protein